MSGVVGPEDWARVFSVFTETEKRGPWALNLFMGSGEVVDALRSLDYRVLTVDPDEKSFRILLWTLANGSTRVLLKGILMPFMQGFSPRVCNEQRLKAKPTSCKNKWRPS